MHTWGARESTVQVRSTARYWALSGVTGVMASAAAAVASVHWVSRTGDGRIQYTDFASKLIGAAQSLVNLGSVVAGYIWHVRISRSDGIHLFDRFALSEALTLFSIAVPYIFLIVADFLKAAGSGHPWDTLQVGTFLLQVTRSWLAVAAFVFMLAHVLV